MESPADSADRYCPFCRDAFPNRERCPDHDLDLVPAAALPATSGPEEEDSVPSRGPVVRQLAVVSGALLMIVGFCLPVATNVIEGERTTVSGLGFAAVRGPVLWAVPAVAAFVTYVFLGRFTGRTRRSVRRAAAALLALSAAAVGYAVVGFYRGATALQSEIGVDVRVELRPGLVVMGVGLTLSIIGCGWDLARSKTR